MLEFCAQIDMFCLQSNVKSLEMEWANFKDAYTTTALEVLGTQSCKRKDHIPSQKTRNLLEERRRSVKQLSPTALNRTKYSKLNKSVKNSAKADEDRWASGFASKLKLAVSAGN